jgi:protein TonB
VAVAGEGIHPWPAAPARGRKSLTAAAIAIGLHAGLMAAVVKIDPARFHAESPIEIQIDDPPLPPPEVKPAAPEPPPPRPEPRPKIAMHRAPTPAPTPVPHEPPPPSEAPPKANEPPPVFGVNLDSTVAGPGEGMAVPVGNSLMTRPGKPAKPAQPAPSGDGTQPFTPAADIYIAHYAEPLYIVNGDDIYPDEARRMGIEGVVVLKLGIDETGKVVLVKVIERAGHGFDEAASKAMWKAKFKPAQGNDGHPLPSSIKYTYRFELNR